MTAAPGADREQLATKADLDTAIAALEARLTWRLVGVQASPFGREKTTSSRFPAASSIRRPPHSPRRESTL